MSLKKYNKKRDFSRTPEPRGIKQTTENNRYLIQKHAASHLHYDLRLELDGVLKSWAVPKGPSLDPSVKRLAVHVEDHPLSYGSFEGIIPKGQYGGGTVMLWDTGSWQCLDSNPLAAYKKGHLHFVIKGKKLKGEWNLVRLNKDPKNWLLIKVNDAYAKSEKKYDITKTLDKSVKSKRSMDEIADNKKVATWQSDKKSTSPARKKQKKNPLLASLKNSPMPRKVSPALATLVSKPPEGNAWLHEIKLDGYRLLAYVENKQVKLITRNQHDWTHKFPDVVAALKKLKIRSALFDGELVALNAKQHSDFQLLQNAIHAEDTSALVFYVFDLLYLNGKRLMDLPLFERKTALLDNISENEGTLRYSDHVWGHGEKILKKACQLGLEGIVSKVAESPYIQKRSHQWLKSKCLKRQEFIVIGWTKPSGSRSSFGSLLLAVNTKKGQLQYCGNVGTGFTQQSLQAIHQLLKKYKTTTMPLSVKPKGLGPITWIKPKLVVEVEFTQWTKDGALRHPSFKGVRKDKKPSQIIREKPRAS